MAKLSRGIRNHNPGNIDFNPKNNWSGLLPPDPAIENRYCRFVSPVYGIRAIMKLLKTYQHQYGLKTITDLIHRWAPEGENNTAAYIQHVAELLKISPNDELNLDDKATMIKLTKAIIQHENGQQPYHHDLFKTAFNLL